MTTSKDVQDAIERLGKSPDISLQLFRSLEAVAARIETVAEEARRACEFALFMKNAEELRAAGIIKDSAPRAFTPGEPPSESAAIAGGGVVSDGGGRISADEESNIVLTIKEARTCIMALQCLEEPGVPLIESSPNAVALIESLEKRIKTRLQWERPV